MAIFFTLVFKMIPFYIYILLGFLAGKLLKAQKETVASLLIYFITPVIIFHGAFTTKITAGTLSLPLLFFLTSVILSLSVFAVARMFIRDTTKNILAFTAGSGNVGYFGLPVAVAIFGDQAAIPVALIILGFAVFENSLGFFITARGHHTVKESLVRVVTLPSIYAFLTGLVLNLSGIRPGQIYFDSVSIFRGAYTLLGMMMIGLGLTSMEKFEVDLKFILSTHLIKFVLWPLAILFIIFLDTHLFRLYDNPIHRIMILISVVPLAANTVAYAAQLKVHPEKAAVAVLLSTIFALAYIPLVVTLFLK